MVTIRSLEPADVGAGVAIALEAFDDLSSRLDVPSRTGPVAGARFEARFHYLLRTDPASCWAAVADGGDVEGIALALRRGAVWGLSLLVVRPGRQGGGVGRSLLAASLRSATDAAVGIICASDDPRAGRAYADAGFRLTPAYEAAGEPRPDPGSVDHRVRPLDLGDREFVDTVDLAVRGGPRGEDYLAMFGTDTAWLRYEHGGDIGYAGLRTDGEILAVAGTSAEAAQALLGSAFGIAARSGVAVRFGWFTEGQTWSRDAVARAGLTVTRRGYLCWRGEPAPTGYVPNGGLL